jgi:outer membrane protein TolC
MQYPFGTASKNTIPRSSIGARDFFYLLSFMKAEVWHRTFARSYRTFRYPITGHNQIPMIRIFFLLVLSFCANMLSAQPAAPLLPAEEAVKIALENNFNIKLVQADAAIATVNDTKGNAGMLPTVNLVAGESFTLSTFQQKLSNGTEFNALGAPFNSANVGVQLNWPLFDGRRMFIAKQRLEAQDALGQLNLQNQVQQTTAAVLQAYYDIVRGRQQEKALTEVITLNQERLRIAEARLAAGFAGQTDALQARIDLNQRRSDLLNQVNVTTSSKRALNQLLARAPETPFEVDETLVNNYTPDRESLKQKIQSQNPTLVSLQKNKEIAALLTDEARTLNKARINGIGQLNALRADNGSGFQKSNTQAGLTLGASLIYPLYSGGNYKRQVESAQLQAQQAGIRVEAQQLSIESALDNQLAFFKTQQQVLLLEEENVTNARENLNVSTERFRLGQTNALETQTAQNTLEQALFRRNLALYNLKITELQLRLLAGEL